MFLNQKQSGKINIRRCADGKNQKLYKTREDTRSPTLTSNSILLSCVIDAEENREDKDYMICIQLTGPLSVPISTFDPTQIKKYIVYEKGIPVIYKRMNKALYGTLHTIVF